MAQMLSAKEQLVKLNIAFREKKIEGARTQYLVIPEKRYYLEEENPQHSKLRKFTIGTKDPEKPNKTVLLVGETGSGKSTLIDALLNHLIGTPYDSKEWCKIVDEEGLGLQTTSSQTDAITVYEICAFHSEEFPYSLTIVDTPGFGDTRGLERDMQLPRVLEMLFTEEVKHIDAVGLVLKESTNRLDDRQSYIFNSVVSLFGKDMENNIVAMITHCSGTSIDKPLKALEEAGIKIARDEKDEPIFFMFQNNQTEVSKGKIFEAGMKFGWSTSNVGMTAFYDFLKKVTSQDVGQTAAVLTKRIQLEACAVSFSERVKMFEAKQLKVQQTTDALKQLGSGKAVKQIDEPYKDLVELNWKWYNVARCTVCQENCHSECNCWSYCKVVGTNCTTCKCGHAKHVRDKQMYVIKTKKVTVEDVEEKYKTEGQKDVLKQQLEKEREELATAKEREIDEIYQCVVELDGIALKGNSFHTYKHLDFLIEKFTELGVERNNEKIQKLKEVKARIEKEGKGVRYMSSMLGCAANYIVEKGRQVAAAIGF